MARYTIILSEGNPSNHKVKLSGSVSVGSETTVVDSLVDSDDKLSVRWEIKKDDKTINSFRIERKTPNLNPAPFTEHPRNIFDSSQELKAKFLAYKDWRYTIVWKDNATPPNEHRHDPIISVKPKLGRGFLGIILALLGLSSLILWRIRRFKKLKSKR